jgi:hypothetical protein
MTNSQGPMTNNGDRPQAILSNSARRHWELEIGHWSFDPVRVEEKMAVTQDGLDAPPAYPAELYCQSTRTF